jgi:hypothetical protein
VVRALVELAVAHEADDARLGEPLGAQAERDADRDRQAVAERAAADLDAVEQRSVWVVAEGRSASIGTKPFAASTA